MGTTKIIVDWKINLRKPIPFVKLQVAPTELVQTTIIFFLLQTGAPYGAGGRGID